MDRGRIIQDSKGGQFLKSCVDGLDEARLPYPTHL